MSTTTQDNTTDPEIVIIDDLSDFEDLERELQANIIKLEPVTTAEYEPVPIARDPPLDSPLDSPRDPPRDSSKPPKPLREKSDSKLIRLEDANKNFPQIQVQGIKKCNFRPVKPQIYYRKSGGQRIKIVPKRTDLQNVDEIMTGASVASSSSSTSEQTVPVTPTSSNSSDGLRPNKRKSQHVIKEGDIEEVQFDGEELKEDEDNKVIMKNLAWLRVTLNYLLEEMGMEKVDFHGRPGKTKVIDKVKGAIESKRVKLEKIDEGPETILSAPLNTNITTTKATYK